MREWRVALAGKMPALLYLVTLLVEGEFQGVLRCLARRAA